MRHVRYVVFTLVLAALASCGTQRTAYTRQPNYEMTAIGKKHPNVNAAETTPTANKKTKTESASNALVAKYAEAMHVGSDVLNDVLLLRFIDDWYGAPYQYGGNAKNGIDCSGFVTALYQNVYQRSLSGTSGALYRQSRKIKRADLQQGDLVFFKINRGRVSHVGVYVANGYFVHASTKAGVVLSNLDEDYYRKNYAGAGRLP